VSVHDSADSAHCGQQNFGFVIKVLIVIIIAVVVAAGCSELPVRAQCEQLGAGDIL
jgi:hypothetical protein